MVHTDPPTALVCRPFPASVRNTVLPKRDVSSNLKADNTSSKNNAKWIAFYSENHIKSTYSLYQQDTDSSNAKAGVFQDVSIKLQLQFSCY